MTRNETFNGLRIFEIPGYYFELLSTVNAVDVKLYTADNRLVADERSVSAGYFLDRTRFVRDGKPLDPFTRIEITTGGNEAVKFLVTDGTGGNRSLPMTLTSTTLTATVPASGVTETPAAKTVTNSSGTLLAANASRKKLLIQNQDASGDIYIRADGGTATATAACLKIAAGATYEPYIVPTGQITAIGSIASNSNIHVIEG